MNITRIRALRGPNLWSRHTAIEAVVECSAPEQDIGGLPGFEAALRERFAEIGPLRAGSEGKVSMANVLGRTALRLQALAGCNVLFGGAIPTA